MRHQLDWEHVDSSNVERVAYVEESETLCVRFRNGGLYTYSGVSFNQYMSMVGAESVGKYLNAVIKGMHPYIRYESEDHLIDALGWDD